MLSRKLPHALWIPRILFSCVNYGKYGIFIKRNSSSDSPTEDKSDKKDVNKKPKKKTDNRRVTATVVEPALESARRKDVHSVVGIHLGPKSLYWAKLNRNRDVLEWSNVDLFPTVEGSRKIQLPKLFAIMDNAAESIPFSDIFVIESPHQGVLTSMSSPAVISSTIFRSQMIAILLTILNLRLENEDDSEEYYHKVFLLKPRTVSRFFNLLVGTERVSALALIGAILGTKDSSSAAQVSEIMDGNENERNADVDKSENFSYKPVNASSSIIESYSAMGAVEREAMSQALLSALAFYELAVFRDPKNLASMELKKS